MEEQAGGKRNAWMSHVKRTMKANKGKSLKQVLKMAGKTYKKVFKGGKAHMEPSPMDEAPMGEGPAPMGAPTGGRRRKGSKTRKSKKSRRGGMYNY